MLQWPKYGGLRDTAEVLLAESAETYAFIEKVSVFRHAILPGSLNPLRLSQMIQAISSPLRSKRIHIGMDEAHGVSEGRYRQLFGYKESTKVVRKGFTRLSFPATRSLLLVSRSSLITFVAATRSALATVSHP